MNCPNCNKEISPDWKLCPFCEYKPKKCSNTKHVPRWLPQEARFCPECGETLGFLTGIDKSISKQEEDNLENEILATAIDYGERADEDMEEAEKWCKKAAGKDNPSKETLLEIAKIHQNQFDNQMKEAQNLDSDVLLISIEKAFQQIHDKGVLKADKERSPENDEMIKNLNAKIMCLESEIKDKDDRIQNLNALVRSVLRDLFLLF